MAATEQALDGLDVAGLLAEMAAGRLSAEQLAHACLSRIQAIDGKIRSVIAVSPDLLAQARASDARWKAGTPRALEGIPVLVKDNIEADGPLPTTAGSLALLHNITRRDAPIVARLRAAGAVILGKTNLSEWANMRGEQPVSGWSGIGGQTRNPYARDRTPSGSSSGSAASVAARLAPLAIGTATDGSITMPASVCGLVGLKPTVGLLSRRYIIPISVSQDTAGPLARHVSDAARMLSVMAGSDPADPATMDADRHRADYAATLDAGSLRGARMGVLRFLLGQHPAVDAVFARTLERLKLAGAILIDVPGVAGLSAIGEAERMVLLTELKTGLASYLAGSPIRTQPQTLSDLIAFNRAHADRELSVFDQNVFEQANATQGTDAPAYKHARDTSLRLAREAVEGSLRDLSLDALIAPTSGPAGLIDPVDGDIDVGSASMLPAVAGTPHLSVPMGTVSGLPIGLSFMGSAWSEARLLSYGFAFERSGPAVPAPTFADTIRLQPGWDGRPEGSDGR